MGSILKLHCNNHVLAVGIKILAPLPGTNFVDIEFAYLD